MTDLASVRPVTRYYLGLAADPYDALSTVTWTEVPNTKVKARTLRWGAQHELQRVEPSYASLTLDNTGGDFEALNPASPYYPNLRPLNRLRIVDTWDGDDYIRFTGYVTDWPRTWTGIGQSMVQLEAYDALGAVLNGIEIPQTPWELQVRRGVEAAGAAGGKAVWLRLNESSGTVAADSSGYRLDGQYQGSPTLGVDGLLFNDDANDKAVRFVTGSRASLPYKNLVSGYPFTFSCWFQSGTPTTAAKMMLGAYDGADATTAPQRVQVFISAAAPDAGKIVVVIANPYPTGTQVVSTILVNDLTHHHLVVVFTSSTNFKIYIDGTDRTSVSATNAHAYPNDLVTGYSIGNNPAGALVDWRFGDTADDILDEAVILDGVALSAGEVSDLYAAGNTVPTLLGLSGMRLGEVLDGIGWPTADRDIDNGLTVVQQNYVAGSLLAYMQRLDVTEGGRLFVDGAGVLTFHDRHSIIQAPYTVSQITFGEGAGECRYVGPFSHGEDDQDIYNDVRVGNVGGTVQVARDTASKDRYGWKTLNRTDLIGTSDEESKDRANRDLAIYAQPATRFRQIIVKPQEDAAQGTDVWPALLGLGQNSRVTVNATPPGASLITQESHVERLEETVTPKDWQITLGLSAAQSAEFWVLGTSELDTGTRLAF